MSSDDFKGRFSLEPTRSETPIAPRYRWYTILIAEVRAGGKHCYLPSAFWRHGALVIYSVWTDSSGDSAQVRSYPLIADLPTNFLLSHIPSNCPPYLKCVFSPPLLVAENISLSDHFFPNFLLLYCKSFPCLLLPIFLHHFCCYHFLVARNAQRTERRKEPKDGRQQARNEHMRFPLQQYYLDTHLDVEFDSLIWRLLSYPLTYGRGELCLCQCSGRNS